MCRHGTRTRRRRCVVLWEFHQTGCAREQIFVASLLKSLFMSLNLTLHLPNLLQARDNQQVSPPVASITKRSSDYSLVVQNFVITSTTRLLLFVRLHYVQPMELKMHGSFFGIYNQCNQTCIGLFFVHLQVLQPMQQKIHWAVFHSSRAPIVKRGAKQCWSLKLHTIMKQRDATWKLCSCELVFFEEKSNI